MLTRLGLRKFRSHDDTVLDLAPINLLIGPVAAGKSNLFRALVLLQNSVHRSLVELFPPGLGEFHWVRSRWADETDPISIEVDVAGVFDDPEESARYGLRVAAAPQGLYVLEETLTRQRPGQPDQWIFNRDMRGYQGRAFGDISADEPTILNLVWHHDDRIGCDLPGPQFARKVALALSSFGYFHLDVAALKSLGVGQSTDRISYRGGRLPDFIAAMKFQEEGQHVYETVCKEMREVLPDLDSIIVTQTEADRQGIAMSFQGHKGYIAAPDLSDGTLLTLGLLCIVYGPRRPALLCIEEPESGLHPSRLRWLFDKLVGLAYPSDGESPTQVIISTHSPYLVDFFRDFREMVQVVERSDGRTRIRPLTKIQAELHDQPSTDDAIGHEWATGLYERL